MKIGIDARILGEPGGVGDYIENLVLKIAEIHPQDEFVLFLKTKEFETKFFNPPVDGTNISAVTFQTDDIIWI